MEEHTNRPMEEQVSGIEGLILEKQDIDGSGTEHRKEFAISASRMAPYQAPAEKSIGVEEFAG